MSGTDIWADAETLFRGLCLVASPSLTLVVDVDERGDLNEDDVAVLEQTGFLKEDGIRKLLE